MRKLLFPPRCAACRELLPHDGRGGEVVLCRECRGEWEMAKISSCMFCGMPMIDCRCMPEILSRAGVAGFVKLTSYDPAQGDGAVNSIVNNLKRIKNKDNFDFFASQLLPRLKNILSEFELDPSDAVVTFCPRRRSARRDYGFDQAEQLALSISNQSGARFETMLRRSLLVPSREQKYLTAKERYDNSIRALSLSAKPARSAAGYPIILVDDMVTTGATLSACAALLRSAEAPLVIAACLAVASGSDK